MTFRDSLFMAAGELLKTKYGLDDLDVVTDVAEETKQVFYEGCSCEWDEVKIPITYRTRAGEEKTFDYVGGFSDFIRALTDE